MKSRREFLQLATLAAGAPLASLAADLSPAQISGGAPTRTAFPYVDGLCLEIPDTADGDFIAAGLTACIADVSAVAQLPTTDGSIRYFRSFEACERSIRQAGEKLSRKKNAFLATRGSDIKTAFEQGKTAVFLQFQGCEPIGEDLTRIELFYKLGLRVLQITHHNNNAFGGGAIEKQWTGLTKLGFAGVERMNELGIIPDLSHASHLTGLDVLKASRQPVILSHGACRALVNNARCMPDEVIRGIGKSGGAMGIFMMSFWLTPDPTPTVAAWIRQIRHVIKVAGIDAAAVANDYPLGGEANLVRLKNNNAEGIKSYLGWWDYVARQGVLGFDKRPTHVVVPELNDIRRMFTLHAALEKDGFKARDIEKILGGNWRRVLRETLG